MTHGHTRGPAKDRNRRSPTYNSWRAMIERCTREAHPYYPHYGGRGITVHPDWRGRGGFDRFLAHVGTRPNDMTLDRIDVDGHYEPGNVQWSTAQQQRWNRRDMKVRVDEAPDEYQVTAKYPVQASAMVETLPF